MKYLQLTIFILFISGLFMLSDAQAQEDPNRIFKYAFSSSDAYIRSFKSDTAGNFYILGSFDSSFTYRGNSISGPNIIDGQNYFIMKTTSTGQLVYLKPIFANNGMGLTVNTFDVNNKGEIALIIESSQDSIIKVGERVFRSGSLLNYKLVTKISKTGYVVWMRIIWPFEQVNYLAVSDIDISEKGDVLVIGDYSGIQANFGTIIHTGFTELSENPFIAKYLSNGDLDWVESVDNIMDPGTPEPYAYLTFMDVEADTMGNIFLSGTYQGTYHIVMGDTLYNLGYGTKGFLAKKADGSSGFSRVFGYETDGQIYPEMIKIGKNGRILFAFYYMTSYDNLVVNGNQFQSDYFYNLLICNFNSDMTYRWVKSIQTEKNYVSGYDGAAVGFDSQMDVMFTAKGLYTNIISGKISDITADTVWTKRTTENYNLDNAYLTIDKSGNIVFAGSALSSISIDTHNIVSTDEAGVRFFARILNTGEIDYVYQKQCVSGTDDITFYGIGTDIFGNVQVVGSFYGTESKIDTFTLSKGNSNGIFLAKYGYVTNISGEVVNTSGDPIAGGIAVLIGYSYYQRSPISDSVELGIGGTFTFSNVPFGNYIILTIPDANYFSTYYPSEGYWERASILNITDVGNHSGYTITCSQIPVLTGINQLSGTVIEEDSTDIFKATTGKAKPAAKAKLTSGRPITTKSTYEVIAETESDENGYFVFSNVEDGEYSLFIEIAGLPNTSTHDVTVAGGTFIANLDFLVTEEYIAPIHGITSKVENIIPADLSLFVYPNPSKGKVTVQSAEDNPIKGIFIYDIQGRIANSSTDISESSIEIENLERGIYFLKVMLQEGTFTTKIIVQQ